MNRIKHLLVFVTLELMLLVVCTGCAVQESNITTNKAKTEQESTESVIEIDTIQEDKIDILQLKDEELDNYQEIQEYIDQGNCIGFAEKLIKGEVSQRLYEFLAQEEGNVLEEIMLDAMEQFNQKGQWDHIATLRLNGYITDERFVEYWKNVGAYLPEKEAFTDENPEVDNYLIHELNLAYQYDEYSVRVFQKMHESGILNDKMHAALVESLGFDYSDISYMEEHNVAPTRVLSIEERAVYEEILKLIDQGDCQKIATLMIQGNVSDLVYEVLWKEEAEILDFVIAQAMTKLSEEGKLEDIILLRVKGFVSDRCFEYYWEMQGNEGLTSESFPLNETDLDIYLVYELEQMYHRYNNNTEIFNKIWNSGLLNDSIQNQLMKRLGSV